MHWQFVGYNVKWISFCMTTCMYVILYLLYWYRDYWHIWPWNFKWSQYWYINTPQRVRWSSCCVTNLQDIIIQCSSGYFSNHNHNCCVPADTMQQKQIRMYEWTWKRRGKSLFIWDYHNKSCNKHMLWSHWDWYDPNFQYTR